jgi:hypothetical protein
MTSPADVTGLKHEVAELWRRFKTEPPAVHADADQERQAVLDATRVLDAKQKALAARRDALEGDLRQARGATRARRVGFGVLGALVGAGLGSAGLGVTFEPLAAATANLPPLGGALVLAATLPALVLLRRR